MGAEARKAMKVETSESGRRFVNIRDVVRSELARIREKSAPREVVRQSEQSSRQNGASSESNGAADRAGA